MAVVSGIVLNRLKIPAIIGYIVTGTLTTYIFGFRLEDSVDLNEAAELGIVFLMFMIGLDFSFKKITQMKQEVLLFGGLQIGISIVAFFAICHFLLRFDFNTSVIIASAVSLSSTAIVLKHLNEIDATRTSYGEASVGILVFQDIAVIPILLIIKLLSDTSLSMGEMLLNTGISALAVLLLLILPGRFLARIALRSSAKMKTDEIFVGTVFLIVLGSAYLSKYFGFSLSLGAFLAGMIVSNSPFKYQVASVLVYFRDLLLGVFFITIGMQVDVVFAVKYFIIVLILCALILLVKTLIMFVFLSIFRGARIGMRVALSLSQIGEFSFAIFLLASQHKILNLKLDGGILSWIFGQESLVKFTPHDIYQFLTLMVIFSMVATPFILERLDTCTNFMLRLLQIPTRIRNKDNTFSTPKEMAFNEVIVCGYGLLGKKVVKFLEGCNINILVIESNYDRVKDAQKDGINIVYGNITDKMIFKEVEAQNSTAVILCVESTNAITQACHHIMDISYHIRIIVQTDDDNLEETLKGMGLYGVINNHEESAVILSNLALKAIEEQKDAMYEEGEESKI
ncbi:NAD-binding protein [Helicobacter turcicus]|uniref:Cation:proton antiporter n=1 Tax=Helicobacter turcicus TaxID=2867412 RepID=A0ABS7JLK2_9HELI|nr:cation:proton antiporter [Helicobacter turcicus]MBX7545153.1 cation:proton antiporter [Helicobacter turcicus]